MPFLSLVTLNFDLDFKTRPGEGPNVSTVWIWRRSVQRFPRYFIHKRKTAEWRRQKQNLPQFRACGNNDDVYIDASPFCSGLCV